MAIDTFPSALGVTVSQLANEIMRDSLRGTRRPALNRLDSALTTASTEISLEFPDINPLKPGSVIEADDELVYVWDGEGGGPGTIQRGWEGTTAASHTEGTVVSIDPDYPRASVYAAMREEIQSWPGSLYAVAHGNITIGSTTNAIDLDGLLGYAGVRLLELRRSPASGDSYSRRESWPKISGAHLVPSSNLTAFPSGYALNLPTDLGEAHTLRVTVGYRFPVGTFAAATDLGSVVGLHRGLLDIVKIGAAARLVTPKAIARVDTGSLGRSRPAEEVATRDILAVGGGLWQLRANRINEEVRNLANLYGWSENLL